MRVVQPFLGVIMVAQWIDDQRLDDAALGLLTRLYAAAERRQEIDLSARQIRALDSLRAAGYIDQAGVLADPFYQPPPPEIPQPRVSPEDKAIAAGSVVYYLRRLRDGAIKIGMSRQLDERIDKLSILYGQLELLAAEPGARMCETRRHRQFESGRLQEPSHTYGLGASEWFQPTRELLAHICALGGAR